MGDCNNQIVHSLYSFYLSRPIAGVFTICPDIFLYVKMFIGTVPIHIAVPAKKCSDFICVLFKNALPKFNDIHSFFSSANFG